jgi:hypothetical protein
LTKCETDYYTKVNSFRTKILGISLSNGLVAVSGALIAQQGGFADISIGVGMIVIGLASVIIGEAIFGARSVFIATLAVVLGSIILPDRSRSGASGRAVQILGLEAGDRVDRHHRACRSLSSSFV